MDTNVITPEGFAELKGELDYLWRKERPEVTKMVQWAASLGDRSENADYQYNKKRLREIDRRVRFLRNRLDKLRVVEYSTPEFDSYPLKIVSFTRLSPVFMRVSAF
jgi:transcription elongation factor GreB